MMPPPIPPNRPNPPPPGGGDNGDNSTAGKTPVAYRTRSTRSQVGSANLNKSGSHQPPGSRSIGAFANAGGDPPPITTTTSTRSIGSFANVGAPPKAMTVGKMPPPTTKSTPASAVSSASAGSASSLSAGVDDAIAKRRAELRRLQQNRGTGISSAMSSANRTTGGMGGSLSTMSAARSRLGGSVGSGIGSGIGGARPGGRGVAATAALLNTTNPTTSTPLASFAGGTPSTAGITRRLDPALAATASASSTPASASHRPPPQFRQITPASKMTMVAEQQQQPPKPTLLSSNMKRTSEIFNVGKQQQHAQKYTGTTSAPASAPATKTKSVPAALNPFSPSGPPRQQPPPRQSGVPVRADNNAAAAKLKQAQETLAYPHIVSSPRKDDKSNMNNSGGGVDSGSPPKSPFGQARVITEPAMPPGKPPIMVPPLTTEPVASATLPKTMMMQAPKQPTMASMGSASKIMGQTKQQQQQVVTKSNNVISSGISTPVTSNVHSNSTTTAIANASEGVEPKSNDGQNKLVEGSKDGKGGGTLSAKEGISPNDKTLALSTKSSPEMSRLMTDLQSAQKEKKEALVQVNTLKSMLEQYEKQRNMGQHNKQQLPPLSASNTTPGGLLDQLKLKVSDRGEKAAIAWIERQLEAAKDEDQSPLSSLGSNNRGRGRGEPQGTVMGEDLLSSVLPPLTPRSRPGSRAASPERGGGGGLLMSQSLGQAMDKLGGGHSARGKRMTTPLPKQLNKGNEGEGAVGSARESVEHEYLVAAAKSIPNEYGTQLASYFVRQPYLHTEVSENDDDNNKWTCYSHLSSEERYHQLATTFDPNSLEILACVEADGSVFTLTGKSDARHGKVPSVGTGSFEEQQMDASAIVAARGEDELDWAIFDDVEEMHRALGRVTYIDVEGNEREYWLDSLYEEALATRESYCMSMISAAFALKTVQPTMQQRPMQTSSPMVQPIQSNVSPPAHFMQTSPQNATPGFVNMQQQQQPSPMYPSQPTMVESPHMNQSNFAQPAPMNPMVQPGIPNLQEPKDKSQPALQRNKPPLKPKSNLPPSEKLPSQPKPAPSQPDQKQPAAKQQPEEEEYESADSALPHMVISLFSLLLSMILIFAKIPVRIGSMLFKLWVVIVVLKVLWLFFADDNGAWEMGAGVDYEYNMPGIY